MALITYPLNNIEYSAEDAELYFCTRNSGIYEGDDFAYSVTGADNTITISAGLAWIRNSKFSGKVAALKTSIALDAGAPDSVYPRIDAVVIQFDANKNATNIVIKQGTAASDPSAPTVSRTKALYELHLYSIRRAAGAAAITAADITDLRLDINYCGLMGDSVTRIDTDAINAQAAALIKDLREEIDSVKDGSSYLPKSGGTMTGTIAMGGKKITGLATPTDDADAATKAYVDGKISITKLWSNASPTSSFAGQTVSLSLSSYNMLLVIGRESTTSARTMSTVTKVGAAGRLFLMSNYRQFRDFSVTTTGVTFGSGYDCSLEESNTVFNTSAIPIEIYGIKGVA